MYSHEYQEAIFASELSSNAKLLALAIAYHYNWKEGNRSFPTINLLVQRSGLSKATIHRAKNELVSQGYLDIERRFNKSNMYLPVIPGLTQTPGMSHTETSIVSHRRTNYEVTNEFNNEIKVDSFQSSTFSNNNKNTSRKEIQDEEQFRPRPRSQRDTISSGQDYKRNAGRQVTDAELAQFNKELAEARADQW